ncbi:MAG: toll/interleukin-1 receptor domain-containing protein, partial [Myxococcota bacterium]
MSDSPRRPRVFLSYGHDNAGLVKRFVARLEARGFDPLWDAMLLAGTSFMEGIETFIAHSHAFVPLITEHSQHRPWVHQEIGFARALNVPILPVMVGVAPDGFIGELHAAPCSDPPTDAEIEGVIARLPNLIEQARTTMPPLYAVARGSLTRHELTDRHLRQILDLDRTGCVRQ